MLEFVQVAASVSAVFLGITYILAGLIVKLNLARRGITESNPEGQISGRGDHLPVECRRKPNGNATPPWSARMRIPRRLNKGNR
jgi:hypothetical protein